MSTWPAPTARAAPAPCWPPCWQAAGYRVGLNTSPYLEDFRERIQINGRDDLRGGAGAADGGGPPRRGSHGGAPHGVRADHRHCPGCISGGSGATSRCWRWAWAVPWTPPTSSTRRRRRCWRPWAWTTRRCWAPLWRTSPPAKAGIIKPGGDVVSLRRLRRRRTRCSARYAASRGPV